MAGIATLTASATAAWMLAGTRESTSTGTDGVTSTFTRIGGVTGCTEVFCLLNLLLVLVQAYMMSGRLKRSYNYMRKSTHSKKGPILVIDILQGLN